MYFTYQDMLDSLIDFLGGGLDDKAVRDSKRAILNALRDLANSHNWSYYYTQGRVITNALYNTGTVTYDHTGGTYERQLTLAGGTWPSWANLGYLYMGVIRYKISQVVSSTVAILDPLVNPGADITTGQAYTLYQDTYALPADFVSQDQALYEINFGGMSYCHPRDWLYENRYIFSSGVPQAYTIRGDQAMPGRMFISVFPFPVDSRTIDFMYKRRPRDLGLVLQNTSGTCSLTLGSNVATGTSTAFTSAMPGAVIRFSSNSTAPTSRFGTNPAVFETTVARYTSATSIVLTDPAPASLSGVAFTVSDSIDVEVGAMFDAFQRGCESAIGRLRNLDNKSDLDAIYVDALRKARAADSRSFASRYAGQPTRYRMRLRDMPLGADQS